MKTLYLLRHAKSSWDRSSMEDFDRPLNERGYEDAHLVAKYFFEKKNQVDLIVSSPAIRAISTALIFSLHLKYPADEILIRANLYESSMKDYFNCISNISKGNSILLTGHNNTISQVAQKLSKQLVNDLKTCTITALQLSINSWSEIFTSKGDLLFELQPSAIKNL